MYQNLKLEKGLYHLTNKSFVQALEALDPVCTVCRYPPRWVGCLRTAAEAV